MLLKGKGTINNTRVPDTVSFSSKETSAVVPLICIKSIFFRPAACWSCNLFTVCQLSQVFKSPPFPLPSLLSLLKSSILIDFSAVTSLNWLYFVPVERLSAAARHPDLQTCCRYHGEDGRWAPACCLGSWHKMCRMRTPVVRHAPDKSHLLSVWLEVCFSLGVGR